MLPNKSYDDLTMGLSALNIRSPGSPINLYVQHPIPIPGHMDKSKVTLKPLMLTKKVKTSFGISIMNWLLLTLCSVGAKEDEKTTTPSGAARQAR